jgi:hypothetical protein
MTTLKKKSSHGAHRLRETRRSLKGCRKARSIWCPGWADKTEDELKEVGMTDTGEEETLPGHGTRSQNYQRDINTWKKIGGLIWQQKATNTTSASGPKNQSYQTTDKSGSAVKLFQCLFVRHVECYPIGEKMAKNPNQFKKL